MNVKGLVTAGFLGISGIMALCAPGRAFCEKWVEFYAEKWNYKSERVNKNLQFRNVYFYDADNLAVGRKGDVTVWVRELAKNDRYYVTKGVPEQETVFKNIRIKCDSKKYEILLGDGSEGEYSESTSENIKPGSCYDKLHSIICKQK